jgi:putative membrane protein
MRGDPMGWHMNNWDWGGWMLMTTTMVAFWALVACVVVVVTRNGRRPSADISDPEQILAGRFASGEIDDEEYGRRLEALRSAANSTTR